MVFVIGTLTNTHTHNQLPVSNVQLITQSPSQRYVAIVRETDAEQTSKNENNKSFAFIEVCINRCNNRCKSELTIDHAIQDLGRCEVAQERSNRRKAWQDIQ
jgi:hypothetical protein